MPEQQRTIRIAFDTRPITHELRRLARAFRRWAIRRRPDRRHAMYLHRGPSFRRRPSPANRRATRLAIAEVVRAEAERMVENARRQVIAEDRS